MKYRQFIFEDYIFDADKKHLSLRYSLDGEVAFEEAYQFPFEFADYDELALDRAIQALFFMAGVSYFKTYAPSEIIIKKGQMDDESAAFFSKTWQRGLGEFFYVNNLDPHTPIVFPVNSTALSTIPETARHGSVIGLGGGKDSLVTIELLRDTLPDITTWSLGHESVLAPLVERTGLPHITVHRAWDKKLLELKDKDAFNGHVPISAIFGCAGIVAAILSGRRDVIVSNEQSANEPTLEYQGVEINHQYSKSQEFERDFQQYLRHHFGDSARYYSFLRPLSEVYIAELFAKFGFEKYKDVFSSCNRAFTHTSTGLFWCGVCPKCAFVFMALTPFVPRAELEAIWGGKNLLLDPKLEPMYRKLLGIEGDKPLECVGEVKESRAAMRLAFDIYPELADKYIFDIPEDYDYRAIATDEMPPEIRTILETYVS